MLCDHVLCAPFSCATVQTVAVCSVRFLTVRVSVCLTVRTYVRLCVSTSTHFICVRRDILCVFVSVCVCEPPCQ